MICALLILPVTAGHAAGSRWDVDPGADSGAIHSYGWMTRPPEVPDQEQRTPALDRLLKESVGEELQARGLPLRPEDEADLLFIYYVDPRQNLGEYSRQYTTAAMKEWLRPVKEYKESLSVVVIDGVSRRDGRLVWRGVFAMKLAEPWTMARKIRKVTAALMRTVPRS